MLTIAHAPLVSDGGGIDDRSQLAGRGMSPVVANRPPIPIWVKNIASARSYRACADRHCSWVAPLAFSVELSSCGTLDIGSPLAS